MQQRMIVCASVALACLTACGEVPREGDDELAREIAARKRRHRDAGVAADRGVPSADRGLAADKSTIAPDQTVTSGCAPGAAVCATATSGIKVELKLNVPATCVSPQVVFLSGSSTTWIGWSSCAGVPTTIHVAPLSPGQRYGFDVECSGGARLGTSWVTMPATTPPETNPPRITQVVYLSCGPALYVSVTDDTLVDSFAVFANGQQIGSWARGAGIMFFGGSISRSIMVPLSLKGTTAVVDVVARDYFGNEGRSSQSITF